MLVRYDLHIHSALSPCADNDMTPVTIVAYAALNGVDMVAISDHNAINNVEVAQKAGEAFGVVVVPAIEVQTAEDVHVLCLFRTFADLKAFHSSLEFAKVKNRPEIFGEQLILDEDDNVVGTLEDLLLVSSTVSSSELPALAKKYNGVAIAAHIDREANGMVQILGDVEEEYSVVELSTRASEDERAKYAQKYKVIVDSDAHTLESIGMDSVIDLPAKTVDALIDYLSK